MSFLFRYGDHWRAYIVFLGVQTCVGLTLTSSFNSNIAGLPFISFSWFSPMTNTHISIKTRISSLSSPMTNKSWYLFFNLRTAWMHWSSIDVDPSMGFSILGLLAFVSFLWIAPSRSWGTSWTSLRLRWLASASTQSTSFSGLEAKTIILPLISLLSSSFPTT